MAAYIRSVMNNSVSDTMIMEFSKRNESYRNWLDLPLPLKDNYGPHE